MYNIIFDKSAEKDLDNLPNEEVWRVVTVINKLSADPRPPGVKKLKAMDGSIACSMVLTATGS